MPKCNCGSESFYSVPVYTFKDNKPFMTTYSCDRCSRTFMEITDHATFSEFIQAKMHRPVVADKKPEELVVTCKDCMHQSPVGPVCNLHNKHCYDTDPACEYYRKSEAKLGVTKCVECDYNDLGRGMCNLHSQPRKPTDFVCVNFTHKVLAEYRGQKVTK